MLGFDNPKKITLSAWFLNCHEVNMAKGFLLTYINGEIGVVLLHENSRCPLITSAEYNDQNSWQFFSFSCKHQIPKANGDTIAPISITTTIWKSVLVVAFSRRIKGTGY